MSSRGFVLTCSGIGSCLSFWESCWNRKELKHSDKRSSVISREIVGRTKHNSNDPIACLIFTVSAVREEPVNAQQCATQAKWRLSWQKPIGRLHYESMILVRQKDMPERIKIELVNHPWAFWHRLCEGIWGHETWRDHITWARIAAGLC